MGNWTDPYTEVCQKSIGVRWNATIERWEYIFPDDFQETEQAWEQLVSIQE